VGILHATGGDNLDFGLNPFVSSRRFPFTKSPFFVYCKYLNRILDVRGSSSQEIDPREIFEKLETSTMVAINRAAKDKYRIIQKRVVLDQVDELLTSISEISLKG